MGMDSGACWSTKWSWLDGRVVVVAVVVVDIISSSAVLALMYSCKIEGRGLSPWAAFFLHFLLEFCLLLVAFQWFFMEFSVLPGICFAISAHLFPTFLCASTINLSSSSFHVSFYIYIKQHTHT